MIWSFGLLSLLSLFLSSLPRRLNLINNTMSYLMGGLVFLNLLILKFGGIGFPQLNIKNHVITFFILEAFLFWLFKKREDKESAFLPSVSIPLICSTLFLFCGSYMDKNTAPYIVSFTILLECLIWSPSKDWSFLFKKTMVSITVVIFSILTISLNAGEFGLPLIVFLYWYTSDLFPLSSDKDLGFLQHQPIANRILLFTLSTNQIDLSMGIVPQTYTSVIVAVIGVVLILFGNSLREEWKNFRKFGEVLLILNFLSQKSTITPEFLTALISFSLYSFLALLQRTTSRVSEQTIIYIAGLVLCAGILFGGPHNIIQESLSFAKLDGVGVFILPFTLSFWMVNFVFWIKAKNNLKSDSKIDHLQHWIRLSAIIMSVIISF